MKKPQATLFTLIFCLMLALLSPLVEELEASTKMPEFTLQQVPGKDVLSSTSFEGKVLYLTFFATWCPPCVQEVPVLVKLQNELESSGFSVIGLSVDQGGSSAVAKFAQKHAVNYPLLMAGSKTTMDFGGVYGIPVGFLVNRSGNVVKKYIGYVQHDVLEKDIRGLL